MQNLPYHPIINFFIQKNNYTSYLELGLRDVNSTFKHIICNDKTSVDINPACNPTYTMSTDTFFNEAANNKVWDIIFVDASHEKVQVLRDIENSLKHLSKDGTIIVDDINPFTEDLLQPHFCHNAWEAFAELRGTRTDLYMFSIESSFCGIIKFGSQKIHNLNPIKSDFMFLQKYRQELLNIRKWEDICSE